MYTSAKPYFYGTGRRKKSIARVRLYPGTGMITVNGKELNEYFGLETMNLIVNQPFEVTGTAGKFDVVATVVGGGFSGQAGAIRHGLSRALVLADEANKAPLKAEGKKEIRSQSRTSCVSVLQEISFICWGEWHAA